MDEIFRFVMLARREQVTLTTFGPMPAERFSPVYPEAAWNLLQRPRLIRGDGAAKSWRRFLLEAFG